MAIKQVKPNITPEVWAEIRTRWEAGVPATRLLRDYGVSNGAFYYHVKKEKWAQHTPTKAASALVAAAKDISPQNMERALKAVEAQRQRDVLALVPVADGTPAARRLDASSRAQLRLIDEMLGHVRKTLASKELIDEGQALKDRTRAMLDLCTVMEKLQKLERTALGVDKGDGEGSRGTVIIVVPQKLGDDEWAANARPVAPAIVVDDD